MKKLFTLSPQYHGHGAVSFAWQPSGNYVASIGEGNRNLFLFDRRGVQVEEVALKSTARVLQLEWDKDGEILAILQQGEATVSLWRHAEKKLEVLEMNSKDPTFLAWSKVGPQLVIGTARGNMMIYNKRTMKKQTVMGKHSKKVTCGVWHAQDNIFACGSEDKTVSVSDEQGDSVLKADDPLRLKSEPSQIQFTDIKSDSPHDSSRDKTVSMLLGDATMLLFSMADPSKPTELAFQQKYGTMKSYAWCGSDYLIIGFSLGYIVVLGAQMREMSTELSSVKYHQNNLDCLCVSKASQKIASAGDDGIRIISMKDFKELKNERITIRPEARVTQMHWSDDGELLSFCTEAGWVYCYLAKLTALSAACNTRLAYLTSLREMTIIDGPNEAGSKVVIQTDVEPAFVALGPNHLATGMNNRIWFYSTSPGESTSCVNEQEYIGTVESVSLNATHACVLIEGRVYLHPIDRNSTQFKTTIFPRKEDDRSITCASIVGNFLVYAHSNGRLQYYSLVDGTEVNEYKHENGIRKCFPNQEGTRVVLIDTMGAAWLYNPVNDDCIAVADFPVTADRILWDTVDSTIFAASDQSNLYTFVYTQVEMGGGGVRCVGNVDLGPQGEMNITAAPTSLQHGNVAVLLVDGIVICQQPSGTLTQTHLRTHELLKGGGGNLESAERQRLCFRQALGLNRFQVAFKLGVALNAKELWVAMGRRCLECLDIQWAKKAYRQAPSPGMVLYLERLQTAEDKQLLSGHVAALLGSFGKAREYFLQSCCPEAALDMHCDFLQWDQALSLAQTLAPQRLPDIYLRSAAQLESKGEQQQALTHYEQALRDASPKKTEHANSCRAGIARTCIRLGELDRGIQEAVKLKDPVVCKECAVILAKMKQNTEAAQLYKEAGAYDQAASLYILDLNFEAAAPLMSMIHTPKLHRDYAKAKESRGAFQEAVVAYERARDLDSVVRLSLGKLNQPQKAFSLVRDTHLVSGAEQIAAYCKSNGNVCGAIEFLLIAKNEQEAFVQAEKHDEMETFETGLGEKGSKEQHMSIAKYYEKLNRLSNAAKHYALCEEYGMALELYKKVGEKEIDNAIAVVGKARNDALTHTLVDYLMGEGPPNNAPPKDPVYVYRLHKALGNYMQAAGTALLIAKQEQEMGNYKAAHGLLFRSYQDLKSQKMALPQELWRRLMILHSYMIVRRLVKAGDHANAAHMLLRVARNIQQFPAHVVPILTSVVIECQRAKMGGDAYQYACTLMQPQYRPQVSEQYKKKIENIVRKSAAEENGLSEPVSPCMYCDFKLPESQLDCPNCKNISPFCIATGLRMVRDLWTYCPSCNFPAQRGAFEQALEAQTGSSGNDNSQSVSQAAGTCCMCDAALKPADLPVVKDPSSMISEYKALLNQTIEPL
jgi:WD repeat-containing protein 19